jgi:hypothetical protein
LQRTTQDIDITITIEVESLGSMAEKFFNALYQENKNQ